jgi:hypothetical protein
MIRETSIRALNICKTKIENIEYIFETNDIVIDPVFYSLAFECSKRFDDEDDRLHTLLIILFNFVVPDHFEMSCDIFQELYNNYSQNRFFEILLAIRPYRLVHSLTENDFCIIDN